MSQSNTTAQSKFSHGRCLRYDSIMARHGAVIQARMGSTRLPGKSLMPIGDFSLIDWVIRYTTMAFDPTDVVLVTVEFAQITEDIFVIFDQDRRVVGIDVPEGVR